MAAKKPKLGSGQRFKEMTEKIQKEGYDREAAKAIAASVGIKKYGKSKMQKMAAKGRSKKK